MKNSVTKKKIFSVLFFISFVVPSQADLIKKQIDDLCEITFKKLIYNIDISKKPNYNFILIKQIINQQENKLVPQKSIPSEHHDIFWNVKKFIPTQGISLSEQEKLEERAFWKSTHRKSVPSVTKIAKTLRSSLQEWGQARLGRNLNEEEVQAFEKAYNYTVDSDRMVEIQYFEKQKILKEAGFSERDLDLLGQKTILRGSETVFVEIPQRTSIEAHLRAKGYDSAYTKGMDEIQELIVFGNQLSEKEVDAYTTHFPYFARKLMEYMAYMETGILDSEQRKRFEVLKKYIKMIIREEGVTYEQWLAISFRFSDILSNGESGRFSSLIYPLTEKFPKTIVLPTTVGGIGFIPLNNIRSEGLEPVGLVTSQSITDGTEMDPLEFSVHDIIHANTSKGTHKLFYDKWKKKREGLPVRRSQNVELAYHILTHETSRNKKTLTHGKITFMDDDWVTIESDLKKGLQLFIYLKKRKGNRVIDLSEGLGRGIQVVVNDFKQIFNEIQKEIK